MTAARILIVDDSAATRKVLREALASDRLMEVIGIAADGETAPGRDPKQPIDEAYTAKMKKYTTAPYFTSPLVDYLPASKTVPTPKAVLGDIAGAPGKLPYAEEVYQYMRLLEKAAPGRVKVVSIGKTEEGRDQWMAVITSPDNMKKLARYKVPRDVEFVDELPRTSTGKVLKRELRDGR